MKTILKIRGVKRDLLPPFFMSKNQGRDPPATIFLRNRKICPNKVCTDFFLGQGLGKKGVQALSILRFGAGCFGSHILQIVQYLLFGPVKY